MNEGANARRRAVGWSKKTQAAFLDMLSLNGNVRLSARAVERSHASACALRRSDPTFAAQWDEALLSAFARLEEELLARAIGIPVEDDAPFDQALALKMLAHHNAGRGAREGRRSAAPPVASLEEVERSLTRKLAALGKRLPAKP